MKIINLKTGKDLEKEKYTIENPKYKEVFSTIESGLKIICVNENKISCRNKNKISCLNKNEISCWNENKIDCLDENKIDCGNKNEIICWNENEITAGKGTKVTALYKDIKYYYEFTDERKTIYFKDGEFRELK